MTTTAVEWNDDLRRGIWPRSAMVWIVALWTALLIIRPWESIFPWLAAVRIERVYAVFAVIALFLSGQFRILWSMQTAGVILWFVALTISSMFAFDTSLSWDKLYVYITVFVFYFALVSAIRTEYQLLFIVTCYVLTVGLFLGKSQWEFLLHGGGGFEMGVSRLKGANQTYAHPNGVAGIAVTSLPFWLYLWQSRHEFTQSWPVLWRQAFAPALGLYFLVATSSIIMTNSRTGMMAFVVFLVLVVMSSRNVSRILASLAGGLVLLAVIWLLMPEKNRHRLETLWAPTEADVSAVTSAEGRKRGFENGVEMLRRFPMTGVGIQNFQLYRMSYLDGDKHVAHNTYGAVLGETGLLGSAAFVFLIVGIFGNTRRTDRLAKLVPNPMVQLLARLTVACRRFMFLCLFVGMAGDYQAFAPLYWVAAYCLLARHLAMMVAQRLESQTFEEIAHNREHSWLPSPQVLSPG